MIGSKSQYAQHRGVTAGRVSQWIAQGFLDEALVDAGGNLLPRGDRSAKILFEKADMALRLHLHAGQVLGQGRELPEIPAAPVMAPPLAAPPPVDSEPAPSNDEASRIQRAKAIKDEILAERAVRQELAERGVYTLTDQAGKAFAQRLADLMTAIEAWLPDLAGKIGVRMAEGQASGRPFDLKELTVFFRDEWRNFRQSRADHAAKARDHLSPFLADEAAERLSNGSADGHSDRESGTSRLGCDGNDDSAVAADRPEGVG